MRLVCGLFSLRTKLVALCRVSIKIMDGSELFVVRKSSFGIDCRQWMVGWKFSSCEERKMFVILHVLRHLLGVCVRLPFFFPRFKFDTIFFRMVPLRVYV